MQELYQSIELKDPLRVLKIVAGCTVPLGVGLYLRKLGFVSTEELFSAAIGASIPATLSYNGRFRRSFIAASIGAVTLGGVQAVFDVPFSPTPKAQASTSVPIPLPASAPSR